MDVNVYIASLVQYGLNKKLVQPCDTIYVTNGLLEAMKRWRMRWNGVSAMMTSPAVTSLTPN